VPPNEEQAQQFVSAKTSTFAASMSKVVVFVISPHELPAEMASIPVRSSNKVGLVETVLLPEVKSYINPG
jgi:hypothetical protein